MSDYHKLNVLDIENITDRSVKVSLSIPKALSEEFRFVPGQYLNFKHTLSDSHQEIIRSYSICSSPNDEVIAIGVKNINENGFSGYICQSLQKGDCLYVCLPLGKFKYKPVENRTTLIASGSGITPILSMLKYGLTLSKTSTFRLLYGNKSVSDTMFYDEIKRLEAVHQDRLEIDYWYSQERQKGHHKGRINARSIAKIVRKEKSEHFYVCGPGKMIEVVEKTLLKRGILKDQIHSERFIAVNTSGTEKSKVSDEVANLKVRLDEEEYNIDLPYNRNILDTLLKEGVDVPYSCQGGVCSSCMTRLKKGSVRMENNQVLTDEEIEDGFILTCQSYPTTSPLEIDYDTT